MTTFLVNKITKENGDNEEANKESHDGRAEEHGKNEDSKYEDLAIVMINLPRLHLSGFRYAHDCEALDYLSNLEVVVMDANSRDFLRVTWCSFPSLYCIIYFLTVLG